MFRALSALLDEETLSERLLWVLPEYTDNAYMIYDDNEGFNWQRAYECHIMGEDYKTIEAGKSAFEAGDASAARFRLSKRFSEGKIWFFP